MRGDGIMKLKEIRAGEVQNLPDTVLKNLYNEFVNDFLTVEKFAEYLEIDIFKTELILAMGKELSR
jgi:hypothetical protein